MRPCVLLVALLTGACGSRPGNPVCGGLDFAGPATVRGIVTYGGMPVAAALLGLGSSSAVTSSDGSFSIASTPAGPQSLSIAPTRAGRVSGEVSLLAGDNLLRIPVVRAAGEGIVAGRTIDGCTGRPMGGVAVSIGAVSATSDDDGLYELNGVCCGTLPPLRAHRAGYRTYRTTLGRVSTTSRWLDIVMLRSP
ncbi:MAG: hypothetical protein ACM3SQ_13965 [Betaproteobacteria bacterium]